MNNTQSNDDKDLPAILDFMGSIDADFGYAVGNLNMDTTPESRKEIIAATRKLIIDAQSDLLSRIKEAKKDVVYVADGKKKLLYSEKKAEAIPIETIDTIKAEIEGSTE